MNESPKTQSWTERKAKRLGSEECSNSTDSGDQELCTTLINTMAMAMAIKA